MHLRFACPPGYDADDAELERLALLGAASVAQFRRVAEAVDGADAVHTDTWVSMGQETDKQERMTAFESFTVDETAMSKAAPGAIFMHCLPAYRGLEVTAGVIDGPQSAVFQQGHNRLHAARGALAFLLGARSIGRRMSKVQRQQTIARLISQHEVINQPQLVELLAAEGISATQATVSRDLDDLGAVKVRVPGGATVYAVPEFAPDRLAPFEQLRRVMGEWVAEVACSANLVVLRTPPGCAHVVASALDRSALDGLVGTVAGDDTVLCVAAEALGGDELAQRLRTLAGIGAA